MTDLLPTVRASLMRAAITDARRQRRRRRAPVALVATAVIAGALVVGSLPGDIDVVERANAALAAAPGEIIHTIVTRTTQTTSGEPTTDTVERWETGDPPRGRLWTRPSRAPVGGVQLAYDSAYYERSSTAGRSASGPPTADPLRPRTADPLAEIRRLISEGALRDTGETTVGGRTVHRLEGRFFDDVTVQELTYDVDPDTYEPLAARSTLTPRIDGTLRTGHALTTTTRVELIERLPLTPENKDLLRDQSASARTGASAPRDS